MAEIIKLPSPEKPEPEQYLDIEHITKMLEFLTALTISDGSSRHEPNIEIRRELVVTGSNQELIMQINQSNETDWQEHPSYYHALIAELKSRGLL